MRDCDHRQNQALKLVLTTQDRLAQQRNEEPTRSAAMPSERLDYRIPDQYASQMTPELRRYFQALRSSFPFDQLGRTLETTERAHPLPGSLTSRRIEGLNDPILKEVSHLLTDWLDQAHQIIVPILVGALAAAAVAGFQSLFDAWTRRCHLVSAPPVPNPSLLRKLRDWAKKRTKQLVSMIDETTRKTVYEIIQDGLQRGQDVRTVLDQVRDALDDAVETQDAARRIADTEAGTAANEGALEANLALGIRYKRWRSRGDILVCGLCAANEAQGLIPIDETFSSGDAAPGAHLNCRCLLEFAGASCDRIARAVNDDELNDK